MATCQDVKNLPKQDASTRWNFKEIVKFCTTFASHDNDPIYHEAEGKVLNFEDIEARNFGYRDVGKSYVLYRQMVLNFA